MQRTTLSLATSCAFPIALFLASVTPAQAQVTASDVVDRASLKAFVERAQALTENRVSTTAAAGAFFNSTFRPVGEWHRGAIYVFVADDEGVIRFHGANQSLEGRDLYDNQDKNGVYYVRELIAAAEGGGGFVEYLFDNPDVVGDEEDGSPKVSYAVQLDLAGDQWLIGSGYYPATATPIVPPLALLGLAALLAGGAFRRLRRR